VRFLWVFPGTYLPRLIPWIGRNDPPPPWQDPAIVAFAGMRGGISLAAALALPLDLEHGQSFPQRDLIIFLTFCVILVTLVGQGLTLPSVIRALGVYHRGKSEFEGERQRELDARLEIVAAANHRLDQLADERQLSIELVQQVKSRRDQRSQQLQRYKTDQIDQARELEQLEMELVSAERKRLHQLLGEKKISDSTRRVIEHELDLYEARLSRER
jgi:monovalent cation/hydrogen antiporter